MAYNTGSEQFKSALGRILDAGVATGAITFDDAGNVVQSADPTAHLQPRIQALINRADALQNEYGSIDSAQGMRADALVNNPLLSNVSPEMLAQIAQNLGVSLEDAPGLAADYATHRGNIADIRNTPLVDSLGGSATNPAMTDAERQYLIDQGLRPPEDIAADIAALNLPITGAINTSGTPVTEAGIYEQANQAGTLDTSPGSDFNQNLARLMEASGQAGASNPAYGLSGSEAAIGTGLQAALRALDLGIGTGAEALTGAQGQLSPYQMSGADAATMLADLSGLNGPEAQTAAAGVMAQDPGYQYALDEGERAILRNASAIGGLGGGNVRKDLTRHAVGMAQQDYNNQIQRLMNLGSQGLNANQMNTNLAGNLASLYGGGGNTAVNLFTGAGGNIANMRYNTGLNMANMLQGTGANLGNLTNQQGINLSNIIGQGGSNVANLLSGSGLQNAQQLSQLATLLANISQNQGTQLAGINTGIGQSEAAGIVDSSAGLRTGITDLVGLGTMAYGGLPAGSSNAATGFNPYASTETYNWTTGNF